MGSGGSSQPTQASLPPPPQPTIQYDPATSAAEAALAGAKKDSFASSVESDEERTKKAALGAPAPVAPKPQRKRAAATMMAPAGTGMGASAVLTG